VTENVVAQETYIASLPGGRPHYYDRRQNRDWVAGSIASRRWIRNSELLLCAWTAPRWNEATVLGARCPRRKRRGLSVSTISVSTTRRA